MPTPKELRPNNFIPYLWVAAAITSALTIRYAFGLETLKQMLPYLMAGPAAYAIIRFSNIFWSAHKTGAVDKTAAILWIIISSSWVVAISLAPFQQWIDGRHWRLLVDVGFLLIILIIFWIGRSVIRHDK